MADFVYDTATVVKPAEAGFERPDVPGLTVPAHGGKSTDNLSEVARQDSSPRLPYDWAHKKIWKVEAFLRSNPDWYWGKPFISLVTHVNPPDYSNPNRYYAAWSYATGDWFIYDHENPGNRWPKPRDNQNSAIVHIPTGWHNVEGLYFWPHADWSYFKQQPLVLYLQNHHVEPGEGLVWEGDRPPNKGNVLNLDVRLEFPLFTNNQDHWTFFA